MSTSTSGNYIDTIRCCLCVNEVSRKFLWEKMETYTLLVNVLLDRVFQHNQFQEWKEQGQLPRKAVEQLIAPFKRTLPYNAMPGRFFTSAVLLVHQIYESWLAIHKKKSRQIKGKQRWLQAVESDLEVTEEIDFPLEDICAKAEELLAGASQKLVRKNASGKRGKKSSKQKQMDSFSQKRALLGMFLDAFEAEEDPLSRRALVHLLKNDLQINQDPEDPDTLKQRLAEKRIEIQRLREQLESRKPEGRDPTGERYLDVLNSAIALPKHNNPEQLEAELTEWLTQKQIPIFNSLPYPVLFGGSDDLAWSLQTEAKPAEADSEDIATPKPSKSRKRKRKQFRQPRERVCVGFKGLEGCICKIQCDRRHQDRFRQFVTDWQTHFQLPEEERFSQALFLLRSACLFWEKDNRKPLKKKQETNATETQAPASPWITHRLYLHCTIDVRLLTAEGTEQVRQEKLEEVRKKLANFQKKHELDDLSEESVNAKPMSVEQRNYFKRIQSTFKRLHNPSPQRPHALPSYERLPHIAMGVSFSRHMPATAVVVDLNTKNVLDCRSTKQLLNDPQIRLARDKKQVDPLKELKQYPLVERLHQQHQQKSLLRSKEQSRNLYRKDSSESNLSLYVCRLIASRTIDLALKWQVGTIVLPQLEGIREHVEGYIRAEAEKKFPNEKELQRKYAREFRASFHTWSYRQLAMCVKNLAVKAQIHVKFLRQPAGGSLIQKAMEMSFAASDL